MQRYIKQEMQEARVQEQEKEDGFGVMSLHTRALSVLSDASNHSRVKTPQSKLTV